MSSRPNPASSCDRPTWNRSVTSPPTSSSAATASWRSGPSSAPAPSPYAWWQAGPWAGKTALASWFVTHPPAGVDIVSFFITGRLAGQADSDAFLDAMIEQLTALSPAGGESPAGSRGAGRRMAEPAGSRQPLRRKNGRGGWSSWWTGSMRTTRGPAPAQGTAQHRLPASPPPPSGVRVIVTSRPDPGLPDDVPSGHPLRTCIPRRLPVSWVAEDLERRAKQELRDLLTGDQVGIDVVGYIAGSGGGLTRSDLSALTGAPAAEARPRAARGVRPQPSDPRVRGFPRRRRRSRDAGVPVRARDPAGHRRGTTRLPSWPATGKEIHDWIGSYADLGWPDSTPGYAIRGYPGLLTATSDVARLSALARDPRRHAFLLRATGSDYAALAEIRTAQRPHRGPERA